MMFVKYRVAVIASATTRQAIRRFLMGHRCPDPMPRDDPCPPCFLQGLRCLRQHAAPGPLSRHPLAAKGIGRCQHSACPGWIDDGGMLSVLLCGLKRVLQPFLSKLDVFPGLI